MIMAMEKKPKRSHKKGMSGGGERKKRKLESFPATGNTNRSRKPCQSDGMFIIRLMRAVRIAVCAMRKMKHAQGMGLTDLYEKFSEVKQQWVDDVVFYRIWPMFEMDQPLNIHVKDMMLVDAEMLKEFSKQIGFVATKIEFDRFMVAKDNYKFYYEMDGDHADIG